MPKVPKKLSVELSKELGKRIEFIRKKIANSLTQESFCKTVAIQQKEYLSAYELGKTRPPWETLISIADKYNVTLDWLIKGVGAPYKEPTLDIRLRILDSLFNSIMKEGRKAFIHANFTMLHEICKDKQTPVEIRRRIAGVIPELYKANPELTVPIMQTLREDYDENWLKSDVRRKVVEAIGEINLLEKNLELAKMLLYYREKDEVYTLVATAEVLWNYIIHHPDNKEIAKDIIFSFPNEVRGVHPEDFADYSTFSIGGIPPIEMETDINYLDPVDCKVNYLLNWLYSRPPLKEIYIKTQELKNDTPTLIYLTRNLHRLFGENRKNKEKNHTVISMFIDILDIFPEESQRNIRRSIVRALPQIFALIKKGYVDDLFAHIPHDAEGEWDSIDDAIGYLLKRLAKDKDILIRRSLTDFYEELINFPERALAIYEILINSNDPLIKHRTERMLEKLLDSEECYNKMIKSPSFGKGLRESLLLLIGHPAARKEDKG